MGLTRARTWKRGKVTGAMLLLVVLLSELAFSASPPAARPDSGDAVLQFLNQTIDWYRRVTTLDQTPVATQDVLFRDAVHRDARQVLSLSFTYARAQAALLAEQGSAPSSATQPGRGQRLNQAVSTAAQRVSAIQSELDQLDRQIKEGAATTRPVLQLPRRIDDLKQISNATGSLKQANEKLRAPLRTQWLELMRRADAISAATRPSEDPQKLQAERQQLDNLAAQLKLMATAGVPLGQQNFALDAVHGTLEQWHESLNQEYRRTLRALFIRLG